MSAIIFLSKRKKREERRGEFESDVNERHGPGLLVLTVIAKRRSTPERRVWRW